MSLSCALWATLLQQWARRYLRRAQPARCSPEKRARMRAFFAEGVDNMHIPWAVEGLPTLLHLSLFFFFGGLAIFLFNVDREVFSYVVCWIGLFSLVYGMITLSPIVRQDSTYFSPLSTLAWMLYTGIPFVYFRILAFVTYRWRSCLIWKDYRDYHHRRMLGGVDKAAEEIVSKRISEIDSWILDWTITTLGDDDSLENFFGAIPGFLNSNLVNGKYSRTPEERRKLKNALNGFWDRTLLSNSASDSVKIRRLGITLEAMNALNTSGVSSILNKILSERRWDDVPHTLEMGQSLARWCTGQPSHDKDTAYYARSIIARILARVQERNDNWVSLATRVFGLPEQDLRDNIALGGDSVLLAILIHVTRPSLRPNYSDWMVLEAVSTFDIHNTLPRLQHDFCTLWNEAVQEARNQGPYTTPVSILNTIHHLYIALHQRTDAAPTASGPSSHFRPTLWPPSSYPVCYIDSHHSDSTARVPVPNSSTVSITIQSSNSPEPSSHSPILHTFPINSGPPQKFKFGPGPFTDVCEIYDSHDQNQTIPMKTFHHQTQSPWPVPSPPDTASNSLEHEGD